MLISLSSTYHEDEDDDDDDDDDEDHDILLFAGPFTEASFSNSLPIRPSSHPSPAVSVTSEDS